MALSMSERVLSMTPLAMSCFLLTGATESAMSSCMICSWMSSMMEKRRLAPSMSPSMSLAMTMRLISPSQSQAPRIHDEGVIPRASWSGTGDPAVRERSITASEYSHMQSWTGPPDRTDGFAAVETSESIIERMDSISSDGSPSVWMAWIALLDRRMIALDSLMASSLSFSTEASASAAFPIGPLNMPMRQDWAVRICF